MKHAKQTDRFPVSQTEDVTLKQWSMTKVEAGDWKQTFDELQDATGSAERAEVKHRAKIARRIGLYLKVAGQLNHSVEAMEEFHGKCKKAGVRLYSTTSIFTAISRYRDGKDRASAYLDGIACRYVILRNLSPSAVEEQIASGQLTISKMVSEFKKEYQGSVPGRTDSLLTLEQKTMDESSSLTPEVGLKIEAGHLLVRLELSPRREARLRRYHDQGRPDIYMTVDLSDPEAPTICKLKAASAVVADERCPIRRRHLPEVKWPALRRRPAAQEGKRRPSRG